MNKYLAPLMKRVEDLQEGKTVANSSKSKSSSSKSSSSISSNSHGKQKTNDKGKLKKDKNKDKKKVKDEKKSSKSKKRSRTDDGDDDDDSGGKKARKETAFTKPLVLSPKLAGFLGVSKMGRTDIVKAMWDYFKEHDLQNPKDKREIILDSKLRDVFNTDSFTMFSMNKYIKEHVSSSD